jgi:hypothetical protein
MEFLGLSFEGLRYYDALLALGGWFGWLRGFTRELAENTSFGELGEDHVAASLEALPRYFLVPSGVSLAMPLGLVEPRMLWPGELVARDVRGVSGVEKIPLQFRWQDFTNAEMGAEMARFAALHRPPDYPEPQRKGKGKASETLVLLDALSVMRICRRYPRAGDLSRRIAEVASVTGYRGCAAYVKAHRRAFRAGDYKPEVSGGAKVEIAKARNRALSFFGNLFPWEMQSEESGKGVT